MQANESHQAPASELSIEPDWVAEWSNTMASIARECTRDKRLPLHRSETLSAKLAETVNFVLGKRRQSLKVTEAQTGNWLAGEDVPREPAAYDALLMALGLRYTETVNGHCVIRRANVDGSRGPDGLDPAIPEDQITPDIRTRIAQRAQLLGQYELALLDIETRPEPAHDADPESPPRNTPYAKIHGSCAHGRVSGMTTVSSRKSIPEAHAGRKHPVQTVYGDLDPSETRAILVSTPSCSEFLACFRGTLAGSYNGWLSQEDFGALAGLSRTAIATYEYGFAIPEARSLYQLKKVFVHHPQQYDRYLELVIRARIGVYQRHLDAGENDQAVRALSQMPREYWREAIRQLLGGSPQDDQAPVWADCLVPIESQGMYFYAVRQAYGKPLNGDPKELETILGMPSYSAILRIESDERLWPEARERMISFYRDLQEKLLTGTDPYPGNNHPPLGWRFFDEALFDPQSDRYLPPISSHQAGVQPSGGIESGVRLQ